MTKLPPAFLSPARLLASGANDSLRNAWPVGDEPRTGRPPVFPPRVSCRLKLWPANCPPKAITHLPVQSPGLGQGSHRPCIVAQNQWCDDWRWLDQDAIRPWQHRSWIFPRDPHFEQKAGRVLDLYQGCWQDQPLGSDDFVISADEKTSIQARVRIHPTQPTQPGQAMRVEFEYERAAPWPIWRLGMSGARRSSAIVTRPPASLPSTLGPTSHEPGTLPASQEGLLDCDNGRPIGGRLPASGYSRSIPTWCWFICRFTPVGLTRWRSTSPSCRESPHPQ